MPSFHGMPSFRFPAPLQKGHEIRHLRKLRHGAADEAAHHGEHHVEQLIQGIVDGGKGPHGHAPVQHAGHQQNQSPQIARQAHRILEEVQQVGLGLHPDFLPAQALPLPGGLAEEKARGPQNPGLPEILSVRDAALVGLVASAQRCGGVLKFRVYVPLHVQRDPRGQESGCDAKQQPGIQGLHIEAQENKVRRNHVNDSNQMEHKGSRSLQPFLRFPNLVQPGAALEFNGGKAGDDLMIGRPELFPADPQILSQDIVEACVQQLIADDARNIQQRPQQQPSAHFPFPRRVHQGIHESGQQNRIYRQHRRL